MRNRSGHYMKEARDVFDDPNLRAYYSDASLFDLYDNVRPPEEYLSPETIAERGLAFRKKAELHGRPCPCGRPHRTAKTL